MKYIITGLLSTLTFGVLITSAAVQASTPDGQTPPNEGVCDDLIGGTPGLYGLCVAFCEAQDYASVSAPITQDEVQALWDQAPSGRILENYNKKKQDGDPDMPCIKVEEPCPCWNAAEFDEATLSNLGGDSRNTYYCNQADGPIIYGSSIQDYLDPSSNTLVLAKIDTNTQEALCVLSNTVTGASTSDDTISPDQFAECDAQIRQREEELRFAGLLTRVCDPRL